MANSKRLDAAMFKNLNWYKGDTTKPSDYTRWIDVIVIEVG